jgi:hypothetical protein
VIVHEVRFGFNILGDKPPNVARRHIIGSPMQPVRVFSAVQRRNRLGRSFLPIAYPASEIYFFKPFKGANSEILKCCCAFVVFVYLAPAEVVLNADRRSEVKVDCRPTGRNFTLRLESQ